MVRSSRSSVVWRGVLLAISVGWLALMALAWGDSARAATDAESEYSFRWLDPEKRIYVLQNRKYTKAMKPMLSAMGGLGLSNPYRNAYSLTPRVAFYFFEWLGVEAFYSFSFNAQNANYQALVSTGSTIFPVVREITGSYGGLAHWVPFYAKVNLFNAILYFDWYIQAGAGQILSNAVQPSGTGGATLVTTPQNLFAVYAGTGQLFYLSQNFVIRLDFLGTFYNAPLFGTTGPGNWYSNYDFSVGLGLKL